MDFADPRLKDRDCVQVWYMQLKDLCKGPAGKKGLVVDVGGNFGWYSLFSAAVGCRHGPLDPLPRCSSHLLISCALQCGHERSRCFGVLVLGSYFLYCYFITPPIRVLVTL
jgi:hypothetical protein